MLLVLLPPAQNIICAVETVPHFPLFFVLKKTSHILANNMFTFCNFFVCERSPPPEYQHSKLDSDRKVFSDKMYISEHDFSWQHRKAERPWNQVKEEHCKYGKTWILVGMQHSFFLSWISIQVHMFSYTSKVLQVWLCALRTKAPIFIQPLTYKQPLSFKECPGLTLCPFLENAP